MLNAMNFDSYSEIADILSDFASKNISALSKEKFVMPKLRLSNELKETKEGGYKIEEIVKQKGKCEKLAAALHQQEDLSDTVKEALEHIDSFYKNLSDMIEQMANQKKDLEYYNMMRDIELTSITVSEKVSQIEKSLANRKINSYWSEVLQLVGMSQSRIRKSPILSEYGVDEVVCDNDPSDAYTVITMYIEGIKKYASENGLDEDATIATVFAKELFMSVYYYNIPVKMLTKRKHWFGAGSGDKYSITVKTVLAQAFMLLACDCLGEKLIAQDAFNDIKKYILDNSETQDFPNYFESGVRALMKEDEEGNKYVDKDLFSEIFELSLKDWGNAHERIWKLYLKSN